MVQKGLIWLYFLFALLTIRPSPDPQQKHTQKYTVLTTTCVRVEQLTYMHVAKCIRSSMRVIACS